MTSSLPCPALAIDRSCDPMITDDNVVSLQWPAVSTTVGAMSTPVHSAAAWLPVPNTMAAMSGYLPAGAFCPPMTSLVDESASANVLAPIVLNPNAQAAKL